jgi:hypothetical protein
VATLEKALLLGHAVAAGVLIGSVTHLGIQAVHLLRGRPRARLLRVYPKVALAAWAVTFALGAWMYPTYRVAVRHEYLDVHAVWASVLFDIKENLAVFVGPLLLAAWRMSGSVAEEADRSLRRWFALACLVAGAIAWWNALAGLLINSVRSV